MKNARVLVGLVLGLSWVGCVGDGAPTGEPDVELVQSALITNAKVNVGGLVAVTDTGGTGGVYAKDPILGGTTITTKNMITVNTVASPAPQAVYQDARLGTFTYTVTGLPASVPVGVRLHFAELSTAIRVGDRQVKVQINGATVIPNLDVLQTANAYFTAVVQTFAAKSTTGGSVSIAVSGAKGQGMLSGYEVWVIDCGPPSKPVGGSVTATKTTVGGVATNSSPANMQVVGHLQRTCTQVGTTGSWTPAAPVCLLRSGQACGTGDSCASKFCVGGTCCQSACNGPCDLSCSTGACTHKAPGASCRTVVGSNPGNNDFQLFCDSNAACVGPTFMCGNSGNTCAADGNTACCQRPIVMDGTTTWTQTDCGLASTCAGNYGENCRSNRDCPTNQFCCFDGGYGFGWSTCHTSACPAGRQECLADSDCSLVPNTQCQNYNGTDFTCF